MSTKATLETKYGIIVVEVPDEDLAMAELLNFVIVPLLRGAGYAEDTIKAFIDHE